MTTTTPITLLLGLTLASAARIYFQEERAPRIFHDTDLVTEIVRNSVEETDTETVTEDEIDNKTLCQDSDWCNEPENYPGHNILIAASKQEWIRNLFPTSIEGLVTRSNFDDLLNKTNSDYVVTENEDFENICAMEADYIRPRAAKNKNGQFKFIVNSPEGADEYIQLVRVVRCLASGSECGGGRLFSGSGTICKQEFLDHKLVALSDSGEELVIDTFQFPSCCTCNYQPALVF